MLDLQLAPEFRSATTADRAFVVALGATVFGHLGAYDAIMGGWFDHPEVDGVIAEIDGRPAGYALWAFTRVEPSAPVALDLIGIAVEPAVRRRGVGRALLRNALESARAAAERLHADHAALSVDPANAAARQLFASEGFRDSDAPQIRYPSGQVAARMHRPLAGL